MATRINFLQLFLSSDLSNLSILAYITLTSSDKIAGKFLTFAKKSLYLCINSTSINFYGIKQEYMGEVITFRNPIKLQEIR